MKALKYTGLKPNQHTVIYDARDVDAEAGYYGSPITIYPGEVVPLDRFQDTEWSGPVAQIHIERGLAVEVELNEKPEPKEDADAES
ncbi:MAG: hypothetical protein ACT4OI_06925 [Methanobacteriota archaeon]